MSRDAEIDNLFQLPLDEFTAARNALAKTAGKDAGEVRALTKPPVAAWAVNQLYWRDRGTWDALVDAAENLRKINKAVLSGRGGDVRAAGAAHDEAVRDALKSTLAILESSGHPATDATRQAVLNTLRALPGDDVPGRLTNVLQPGAFEMLAGLTVAAPARKATKGTKGASLPTKEDTKDTKDTKGTKATKATKDTKDTKEHARALTQAREAAAAADRALKDAEQSARRHEFEIARAARDEERAGREVEQARAALEEARQALANAQRDQADAAKRRKTAEEAAKKGATAVTAARRQSGSAHAALEKLD